MFRAALRASQVNVTEPVYTRPAHREATRRRAARRAVNAGTKVTRSTPNTRESPTSTCLIHALYPEYGKLGWEWARKFSRDQKTGAIRFNPYAR